MSEQKIIKSEPVKIPSSVPASVKEWFTESKFMDLQESFSFKNSICFNHDMGIYMPLYHEGLDIDKYNICAKSISKNMKNVIDADLKSMNQPYEVVGNIVTFIDNHMISENQKFVHLPIYSKSGKTVAGTVLLRNLETRLIGTIPAKWMISYTYANHKLAIQMGMKEFAECVIKSQEIRAQLIKNALLTK